MEARLHGFRMGGITTCSLQQLATYAQEINAVEFTFFKRNCVLFTGEKDGKTVGLLLTLKDQRRFPEIELGDELKVVIHEVEDGRSPFDFNFFAFDPATGGGVYQYYRGSCSIYRFEILLGQLYDDLARNECAADAETLLGRANGRRLRKDRLEFSVVYRRENFERVVRELTRVTSFQYDIVTQADMSQSFRPLAANAKLERRTIRFNTGVSGGSIIDGIISLVPSAVSDQMFRVSGHDNDGERTVDLMAPKPDDFAVDDVDELADEVVLKLHSISDSPYVDTMLSVLAENPGLLGEE